MEDKTFLIAEFISQISGRRCYFIQTFPYQSIIKPSLSFFLYLLTKTHFPSLRANPNFFRWLKQNSTRRQSFLSTVLNGIKASINKDYIVMQIQRRKVEINFELNSVARQLREKSQLSLRDMSFLILKMSTILKNEPNILNLTSPLTVVGDIHGQFYDMLHIFQLYGNPPSRQYLFLGDYVDRGTFSIEVIIYLFVCKLKYPDSVHLLRGNHETRGLTSIFNFKEECLAKYNQAIYQQIMNIFEMLPIAAIIDKKIFAVHGGISPHCKTVNEIQQLDRFKEVPMNGGLCDLLWSDPIGEQTDKWKPNTIRQCSFFFGINQARNFLSRNSLKLIIRGHQVEEEGYKYQKFMNVPLTLTVFSAPNYGDIYKNKGCVAHLDRESIDLCTFSEVQHPVILPDFKNAFQWSVPFIGECVQHLTKHIVRLQNQKLSKKLLGIVKSKHLFKNDFQQVQKALIIQKILTLSNKNDSKDKGEEKEEKLNLSSNPLKIERQDFIVMKVNDKKERLPELGKLVGVIGPKLNVHNNTIKSIDLEDEISIDPICI